MKAQRRMKDERNLLSPKNRPQRQRDLDIARSYFVDGETTTSIGKRLSLSRARVNQIIATLVNKHRYSDRLPHYRLPDDIAAKLDAARPRPAIGSKAAPVEWTPQDVEAETIAGYWRMHVRIAWKQPRSSLPPALHYWRLPTWTLSDYMQELGIPAPTRSPVSHTPACGRSPPPETAPRSR